MALRRSARQLAQQLAQRAAELPGLFGVRRPSAGGWELCWDTRRMLLLLGLCLSGWKGQLRGASYTQPPPLRRRRLAGAAGLSCSWRAGAWRQRPAPAAACRQSAYSTAAAAAAAAAAGACRRPPRAGAAGAAEIVEAWRPCGGSRAAACDAGVAAAATAAAAAACGAGIAAAAAAAAACGGVSGELAAPSG